MGPRPAMKVPVLLATVALLLLAGCSDDGSGGGGKDGGKDGAPAAVAACEGTPGEKPTPTELGAGDEPSEDASTSVGLAFDLGGKDDHAYNQAAYEGLVAAEESLGVDATALETNPEGTNREELLRQLADDGNELVIGVGPNYAEPLALVAPDYPSTDFVAIDTVIDQPNVTSLTFAVEEGSYLAGAIAAQTSKSGIVGFVGGPEDAPVLSSQAGFEAGATKVDPDIEVKVAYLSEAGDAAGFANAGKANTTAAEMYKGGADVVFHDAQGSGAGVFTAAVDNERLAIGSGSDQYFQVDDAQQACMLSSMIKRVDVAVYDTVKAAVEGTLESGERGYGLANDGITFSVAGGQVRDLAELDDLEQQILDGKIEVPTEP